MRAAKALRGRRGPARSVLPRRPGRLDDDDPVREQQGVEDVVGDDDGRAVPQDPAERLPQRRGDGDVERGHRLVEQQEPRLGGQRPGDRDALGLSSGELGRARSAALGADLGEPRGHRCGIARRAPAAARPEGDVVERGQVREQQRVLGEQRHPRGRGRDARRCGVRGRPTSNRRGRRGTTPASGRSRPAITASTVDLPAPLGPSSATVSPSRPRARPRRRAPRPWRRARAIRCPSAAGQADDHDGDDDEDERERDGGIRVGLALQVDLQRQGPGHALEAAGEGDRRAELAQCAGEGEHGSRRPGRAAPAAG